jgi:hypothetical protein
VCAELLREGDLLVRIEVLIAEAEHVIADEGVVDRLPRVRRQGPAQIQAHDRGAEDRRQGFDFESLSCNGERHAGIPRGCAVPEILLASDFR